MANPNRKYHTADEVSNCIDNHNQYHIPSHKLDMAKLKVGHKDYLDSQVSPKTKHTTALKILNHEHPDHYEAFINHPDEFVRTRIAKKAPVEIANKLNKLSDANVTHHLAKRNIGRDEILKGIRDHKFTNSESSSILGELASNSNKNQLDEIYNGLPNQFKSKGLSDYFAKRASELGHKPMLDHMISNGYGSEVSRYTPYKDHIDHLFKDKENWYSLLHNNHLPENHMNHIIKHISPTYLHDCQSFTHKVKEKLLNHPDPSIRYLAENTDGDWDFDEGLEEPSYMIEED